MFSPVITDLAKPRWIAALTVLKTGGEMAISEMAERLGVSYMAAKQYGEDLTRLGYLERIRTPRTAVGRPEIAYRVAPRADALFPDIGMELSLEFLQNSRQLFGENAPDRLIYQHFESLHARWTRALDSIVTPSEKARNLAHLRTDYGAACFFQPPGDAPARLVEHHHPLKTLFHHYPRAIAMDTRLIGDLLGTRVERRETGSGPAGPARVEHLLLDMPALSTD